MKLKLLVLLVFVLSACSQAAPAPTATLLEAAPSATLAPTTAPTVTETLTPTAEPTATQTLAPTPTAAPLEAIAFDSERAFEDVKTQVAMGPRTPGSEAHAQIIEWMQAELTAAGWEVELQQGEMLGHSLTNVIARRGQGKSPWIILGAHYDTRMVADEDPDASRRAQPVPGANDGASGVAVLMELARTLPADLEQETWLAFFDIEDQGSLPDWDWILGSTYMAEQISKSERAPNAVIVVDMVGDQELNLPIERSSDPFLVDEIWSAAAELGYEDIFINEPKWTMIDDHTPFLQKGYPAVDIIDFDYPYWHTAADTPDQVSAESLKAVGDTLARWLIQKSRP